VTGTGIGVCVGSRVAVGSGVGVDSGVAVGCGVGVSVGGGVLVGTGVASASPNGDPQAVTTRAIAINKRVKTIRRIDLSNPRTRLLREYPDQESVVQILISRR
jgi:hypothetical protein